MANNVTYGIRLNGHEKSDIVLIPGDLKPIWRDICTEGYHASKVR